MVTDTGHNGGIVGRCGKQAIDTEPPPGSSVMHLNQHLYQDGEKISALFVFTRAQLAGHGTKIMWKLGLSHGGSVRGGHGLGFWDVESHDENRKVRKENKASERQGGCVWGIPSRWMHDARDVNGINSRRM